MSYDHAYRFSNGPDTGEHESIKKPTEPLRNDMQVQKRITKNLNKYKYPEFEGYAGEDLLKEIVAAVLPLALYRTWEATMSFGGEKPWVGTDRISQRASITQRKIQMDLKEMQDLGLLEIKVGIEKAVTDNQITNYRAEYKDFSGLYKLAHEYHEWRQSRAFLIYQPVWQDCMRLRENHELYLKIMEDRAYHRDLQDNAPDTLNEIVEAEWHYQHLLKFHNYRRLLTQKLKPGQGKGLGEIKTHNGHCLHKTKNSDCQTSPYIETLNSNYRFDKDSNLTQDLKFIQEVSPLTRSSGDVLHDERGTHEEDFTGECGKGSEEQYDFEFPSKPKKDNISQREAEPNVKGNARENAKDISAQQFGGHGDHIVERAIKEKKRIYDSGKEKCREEAEKSKAIRERNKAIINLYSHIAHELNDEYEKSTGTSLVKMYEAWEPKDCEKSLETFTERFDYARKKVLAKPDKDIIKRTKSGEPNRTPLLKTVIQGALTRGLEACAKDDEQARKIRDIWKVLGHKPTEEELAAGLQIDQELGTCEDALAQAENNPQIWLGLLAQHILESRKAQQEIMTEIFPSDSRNKLTIDQPEEPVEQNQAQTFELPTVNIITPEEWTQAKIAIKAATGKMILPNSGCPECGCRLGAVIIGQKDPYCVECCNTIPGWTEQMYRNVDEIICQLYRHEIA